uniref:Uncharacterized protein n=1 Tax=Manihot esculenta TaxID=3983 RepID=A0A2C9VN88_MANES
MDNLLIFWYQKPLKTHLPFQPNFNSLEQSVCPAIEALSCSSFTSILD